MGIADLTIGLDIIRGQLHRMDNGYLVSTSTG
jgi:hypothetical protein